MKNAKTFLFLCYTGTNQNKENMSQHVTVGGVEKKKDAQAIVKRNFPSLIVNCGWTYNSKAEADAAAKRIEGHYPLSHIDAGMQRGIASLLGL